MKNSITTVKHLTIEELEAGLADIRQSPKDNGVLKMLVRRPREGEREILVGEVDRLGEVTIARRERRSGGEQGDRQDGGADSGHTAYDRGRGDGHAGASNVSVGVMRDADVSGAPLERNISPFPAVGHTSRFSSGRAKEAGLPRGKAGLSLAPAAYGAATRLIRVDQLASAVRVPPHSPKGAAEY